MVCEYLENLKNSNKLKLGVQYSSKYNIYITF